MRLRDKERIAHAGLETQREAYQGLARNSVDFTGIVWFSESEIGHR